MFLIKDCIYAVSSEIKCKYVFTMLVNEFSNYKFEMDDAWLKFLHYFGIYAIRIKNLDGTSLSNNDLRNIYHYVNFL
jgi:hypothetical protein